MDKTMCEDQGFHEWNKEGICEVCRAKQDDYFYCERCGKDLPWNELGAKVCPGEFICQTCAIRKADGLL